LPQRNVTLLDTGCCGMAGAFGQLAAKQELSRKVAEPLVQQIGELTAGTEVIACGTSCRHQIADLTRGPGGREAMHVVRVLERALERHAKQGPG